MIPAVFVEPTTFTVTFDHLYDGNEELADWFSLVVAKSTSFPTVLDAAEEAPIWCVLRREGMTHRQYLCRDNVFRRGVSDYDPFYGRVEWPRWNRWRHARYDKLSAQFDRDRCMTQHEAFTLAVQYLPRLRLNGHSIMHYLEGGDRASH